jgi:hypothetical protein
MQMKPDCASPLDEDAKMFGCSTMMFGSRTGQVLDNAELFDVFDSFGLFGANCYWGIGERGATPMRARAPLHIKSLFLSRTVEQVEQNERSPTAAGVPECSTSLGVGGALPNSRTLSSRTAGRRGFRCVGDATLAGSSSQFCELDPRSVLRRDHRVAAMFAAASYSANTVTSLIGRHLGGGCSGADRGGTGAARSVRGRRGSRP